MVSILFVCLGNICRSPTAEGIFRSIATERGLAGAFEIDSAGTGGWHTGKAPDARAVSTAAAHGVDISRIRARQVSTLDFHDFDFILAMDTANLAALKRIDPGGGKAVVDLFLPPGLEPGMTADRCVPDPYYGGPEGFEQVFALIWRGAERVFERVDPSRSSRR